MRQVPVFPPLMTGLATGPANPAHVACDKARRGVDAGLVTWSIRDDRLRAAIVLAPETPLEQALAGFIACAVGFQNALGVLAPAETAVHLEWTGGIRINGGHAGGLHLYAAPTAPGAVPDWLVVGLELTLLAPAEAEAGRTPDWTTLYGEGCGDVLPLDLLEAWTRHSLVWINELDEAGGRGRLHREYTGLVWKMNETQTLTLPGERPTGRLIGCDEDFGALLRGEDGTTRLIPLSAIIEKD